jgi:hypothetical protein
MPKAPPSMLPSIAYSVSRRRGEEEEEGVISTHKTWKTDISLSVQNGESSKANAFLRNNTSETVVWL